MAWLKRYKVPLLLIILLPQAVNLLCCWMLSSRQMHEIPTAVFMGDNTALSRKIVTAFDNHDTFDVVTYADSPEAVPELIRQGKAAFGLVIPRHFTEDLTEGKSPVVMTVVDGSQLSAASFTKIASSEILLGIKQDLLRDRLQSEYSLSSTQAEHAVSGLVFQNRLLGNPTRNYLNFLLPGMMTALVQVGLSMAAASSSEEGPGRVSDLRLAARTMNLTAIGFASMALVLGVQGVFFQVPFKSGILKVLLLSGGFSFAVAGTGVLLSSIFADKVFASQVAAVWFIPSSILSGYTWPLLSMPKALQKLAWMMPYTHYGDTLRNLLLRGVDGKFAGQLTYLVVCGVLTYVLALGAGRLRRRWDERRGIRGEAA